MTVEIKLQTALKIADSNFYCKITFLWLDSSLSVHGHALLSHCYSLFYSGMNIHVRIKIY